MVCAWSGDRGGRCALAVSGGPRLAFAGLPSRAPCCSSRSRPLLLQPSFRLPRTPRASPPHTRPSCPAPPPTPPPDPADAQGHPERGGGALLRGRDGAGHREHPRAQLHTQASPGHKGPKGGGARSCVREHKGAGGLSEGSCWPADTPHPDPPTPTFHPLKGHQAGQPAAGPHRPPQAQRFWAVQAGRGEGASGRGAL